MSKQKYTDEYLHKKALEFSFRSEFQKKYKTLYNIAHRRGILDLICSHMDRINICGENNPNFKWSKEEAQKEASFYTTRQSFRKNSHKIYSAAWREGWLDEICAHMGAPKNKTKTVNEVSDILNKEGYTLLSDSYKSAHTKIRIKCPKDHIYVGRFNDFQSGYRCRKCSFYGEIVQKEISDFIINYYPGLLENDRTKIKPKELDFYLPELNMAIEYCGLWCHSEEFKPNTREHYNKMVLANKQGIRLITIFSDEWINRKDQVKNFIISAIGKNPVKVGARETNIKTVDKLEAKKFLDDHHIQGSAIFDIAMGLYFQNELVGLITGGKHHRQGHNETFVLNRLVFKSGVTVSGGASRLLKALIDYAKFNGYSRLISWSDNRWSEGGVYKKTGFTLTAELPPDYSYVHNNTRISKQSCQKKNLIKKGAKGDMSMTERELALTLKYYRIWDCGKKQWEIDLKS